MRPRWARRLALSLLGLAVIAGAAEFGASRLIPRSGVTNPDLYVSDPTRGQALRPGFKGTITRAGHSFDVTINAQGYRDTAWQLGDPRPHILLVGSSATFGVGLPQDQTLAAQLARDLGNGVRVFNTGTYTYGLVSELETIRRECAATHPYLVLYLHEYKNSRNDFLALRPNDAEGKDDPPPPWGATFPALRALLSIHFVHPRQLTERLIGLDHLSPSYLARYEMTTGAEYPAINAEKAASLIADMASEAEHCGAVFRMALLPGPSEAYYGLHEPASEALLAVLRAHGFGDQILDTRAGIKLGSRFFLSAYDYPNGDGAAYLAAAIASYVQTIPRPQ